MMYFLSRKHPFCFCMNEFFLFFLTSHILASSLARFSSPLAFSYVYYLFDNPLYVKAKHTGNEVGSFQSEV